MNLRDLNACILFEWVGGVSKSMKKNGTIGAFTQQCRDMGFQKASYNCISHVYKEFEKKKVQYENKEIDKKEYDEWALKKKRASLAKTFKGWSKKGKEKKG